LHGGDETGEASKFKQIAEISSITLDMLGAGGMANYVEQNPFFERRLRRARRPEYKRQQGGGFGGG
jgi:hypothetical protein